MATTGTRSFFVALAFPLLLQFLSAPAEAGVPADELCSGDPCVIEGTHTLPDSLERTIIDFGNRAVIINGTLDIGQNEVLLSGRTFEVGGEIRGSATEETASGSLEMVADNFTFQAGSAITLRGNDISIGGFVDIFAFDSVTGSFSADVSGGFGGAVSVTAVNAVVLVANVQVGDLGSLRFDAGCSLMVLAGSSVTATPSGLIEFVSGGTSVIAGNFDAGDDLGENIATHRPDQSPPDTTAATFNPALIVEEDALIAACSVGPGPTPTPTATLEPSVTPTPTATVPSPTPTPTRRPAPCLGDCDGDGRVTVDEVITMVNIALGSSPISACEAGDVDGGGQITVDEIVTAVNLALDGCPTA
jgi:hypothetical protein